MLQNIYDKNIIIYTFIALCALGLLLRVSVNLVYKKLIKESDVERLSETRIKMLSLMKKKFVACYKLKIGVNNVDIFVDKSILKYRFCGLLLSTWDNAGGQVLFLNLLLVPIVAVFGVTYDCGQSQIMMAGSVGILSSAILIFVDKSMNISLKKSMLRLNLLEYLNNYCKVRLENPELVEKYRQEFNQVTGSLEQTGAASALLHVPKDELSRRREARVKKEEEKKLQAAKREEELRKAEEARKEDERRKLEEKRQAAAKRREEERLKLEEEKAALEARLAEMKRKASQKQLLNEQKQKEQDESDKRLAEIDEESKTLSNLDIDQEDKSVLPEQTDIIEPVSTEDENKVFSESVKIPVKEKQQKTTARTSKSKDSSILEDKLIEDVLREFFA